MFINLVCRNTVQSWRSYAINWQLELRTYFKNDLQATTIIENS